MVILIRLFQDWANYGPRDHFMRPAGTYRNMNSYRESSRNLFLLFSDFQWKTEHLRTCRPFSALPINAACGFKIFKNVALGVKKLPAAGLFELQSSGRIQKLIQGEGLIIERMFVLQFCYSSRSIEVLGQ